MAVTCKFCGKMFRIILFLAFFISCFSSKLNVPKLLLPYYSDVATNFTLEVNKGCFAWHSTRPEIVSVTPVDSDDCSSSAIVTPTSRIPSRKTAIIIAKDAASFQELRCDVIIDVIHGVYIETTTHELYLDDSPEEFILRATNDEGDVFSSLDGVVFDWNLLPDGDSVAQHTLRILTYLESSYAAPPHIHVLEQRGRRGNRILVRGSSTGAANVVVRPTDRVYRDVAETSVRIMVVANLQLSPPVVYVLEGAHVAYRVELLKQGKVQQVKMPSSQYILEVANEKVATLLPESSVVVARSIGDTEITLKDRNINLACAHRDPSAGIFVVSASYMQFVVLPGRSWILETGKFYEITVEIFDKESRRIYPSKNLRVKANIASEYLAVHRSTSNGTHHGVATRRRGYTTIEATLDSIVDEGGYVHRFESALHTSQEVEIFDRVVVDPRLIVLPWDASDERKYHYTLRATGGSGNYTWSSHNRSVAGVSGHGRITTALSPGVATVRATDTRSASLFDTAKVYVLSPIRISFLPSRVEAEVGSTLTLPLAVYGMLDGSAVPFDDCQSLRLDVAISGVNVFTLLPHAGPSVDGSCVSLRVEAGELGHATVGVTYVHQGATLQASVTVATYRPLTPIDPEEVVVVSAGSSYEVIFGGGPQPWVLDPGHYYRKVDAEKPTAIQLGDVHALQAQRLEHGLRVTCTYLGDQNLTMHVGNLPSVKNPFPVNSSASIRFACAAPKSIQLIPMVRYPTGLPACTISAEFGDPVPVHNRRHLVLRMLIADADGRQFANASSLLVHWQVSNTRLVTIVDDDDDAVAAEVAKVNPHATSAPKNSYKVLEMLGGNEVVSVKAMVKSYDSTYIRLTTVLNLVDTGIFASRRLCLVENARISPSSITIYNHPSNEAELKIENGSTQFYLDHGADTRTEFNYDQKSGVIRIIPREEGVFTLTAFDLCLEMDAPAVATVYVSDVYSVRLTVVDKVELQKSVVARVQVSDRSGQLIPVRYFPLMNLTASKTADIISLSPIADGVEADEYTALYRVKGLSLGRTILKFVATQKSELNVWSDSKEIQVFPKLKLSPRNVTLIIGATLQLMAIGGPQPQSDIEFAIAADDVAKVSSGGLIDALGLGVVKVKGYAVGVSGESGEVIVYSEDEMTVNVVLLTGIRIFAPLQRMQSNTEMSLYVMGVGENETPFSFGSAVLPLLFHWTISNAHVGQLNPLFYKSRMRMVAEGGFSVRLASRQAGHVTVQLAVQSSPGSRPQITGGQRLTDDLQIQVFERLKLIGPDRDDAVLIMSPETQMILNTNRDGSSAKLTYAVLRDTAASTTAATAAVVAVTERGHVIAGSRCGSASVLVTAYEEELRVNQSLVILVKVKHVSYLMLNADTVIHTRSEFITSLPVGATVHFTVSFHDDVGVKFDATNNKINFRANRFDRLQVSHGSQNDTLMAKATNVGQTVLKVWDRKNPALADYIGVDVGFSVEPAHMTVVVGDVVCFSCPLTSSDGHVGSWSSSSAAMASVDSTSGIVVAMQPGTTTIGYEVGGHQTVAELFVRAVTRIILATDNVAFVTTASPRLAAGGHDTFFTARLEAAKTSGEERRPTSAVIGTNCSESLRADNFRVRWMPFRCDVSLVPSPPNFLTSDLLQITAEFDLTSGSYRCRLSPSPGATGAVTEQASSLDVEVEVRATLVPSPLASAAAAAAVTASVVRVPFAPAFAIHQGALQLTNLATVATLTISASENVRNSLKVSSSDESVVMVRTPKFDAGLAVFAVTLTDLEVLVTSAAAQGVTLEVTSSLTGQSETIPVSLKLIGQTTEEYKKGLQSGWRHLLCMLGENYQNIVFLLLCILATAACIFIAYQAVLGQRFQQMAPPLYSPFLPPGAGPVSPGVSGSPWASPQNTSGSPKLWSVNYGPYDSASLYRRSPQQQRSPFGPCSPSPHQ